MTRKLRNQAALLCSAMASERAMRVGCVYTAAEIADHLDYSSLAWRIAWDTWWSTGVGPQSEQWAKAEAMLRNGEVK